MIPNIFHFIYGLDKSFGNKPFSISHYLAVKSAKHINKPDKIYFYYKYEPTGEWWEKTKPLVEEISISVPNEIFGNKLYHYAHKADVLRLLILNKFGGIYLDIDTICVNPISNLRKYPCVLAKEIYNNKVHGLCNAIILAAPKSLFIQHWLNTYRLFRSKGRDEYWAEHSVRVPWKLALKYPSLIHIEDEKSFYYPSYSSTDLKLLFEGVQKFPEAYIIHLWESFTYEKYLMNLTISDIRNIDNSYSLIARKFL